MSSKEFFTPNDEAMTTIVLPTIAFCVGLIVAMLVGINKCKQWDLDKIVEMRRTRRCIQRITERLREKNFQAIQKARRVRKERREVSAAVQAVQTNSEGISPPLYSTAQRGSITCGRSPPPSYEDALLDEYYNECKPSTSSSAILRESSVSTKMTSSAWKTSAGRRVSVNGKAHKWRAADGGMSQSSGTSTKSTGTNRNVRRSSRLNNNAPHLV